MNAGLLMELAEAKARRAQAEQDAEERGRAGMIAEMIAYIESLPDPETALTKMERRALDAEAALSERNRPCVWIARKRTRGVGTLIEPTCQRSPDDLGFISAMETNSTRFCPNCGRPLVVQQAATSANAILSGEQEEKQL